MTAPVVPQQRSLRDPVPVALRPRLEATWAVFCGAVASGGLAPGAAPIARLLAGWLLADIILGFALTQLLATMRGAVEVGPPPDIAAHRWPRYGDTRITASPHYRIPYAQPGSPGDRLARTIARWLDHWHARLRPAIGHHVASFVTASATALLVGAYLGQPVLMACAVTIGVAGGLALICGRNINTLTRWYAGLALGIAWYLGHRLFAVVSPASWGVAALVGLAALGRMAHAGERVSGGRRLVGIVWSVLVLAMLVARQPIAAGVTAVAGLAETMALGEEAPRPTRMGWLAAMLLAALIVARMA